MKISRVNRFNPLILIVLCVFLLTSCLQTHDFFSRPSAPTTLRPASEAEYTSMPFKKAINPAFADEVSGKWIRSNVKFDRIFNVVSDLPLEYRKGFVRIMVVDAEEDSGSSFSNDLVMAKNISDILFNLKTRQKIEIFAYLQPIITRSVNGAVTKGVLFRIERVKLVE